MCIPIRNAMKMFGVHSNHRYIEIWKLFFKHDIDFKCYYAENMNYASSKIEIKVLNFTAVPISGIFQNYA